MDCLLRKWRKNFGCCFVSDISCVSLAVISMSILSLLLFFAGKSFCLYSLEFSLFRYYCCVCLLFFLPVAVRVLLRLLVISQNNDTRVMFDMILFFPIIYFDIHRMRLGLLLIANTLLRLLLNNCTIYWDTQEVSATFRKC